MGGTVNMDDGAKLTLSICRLSLELVGESDSLGLFGLERVPRARHARQLGRALVEVVLDLFESTLVHGRLRFEPSDGSFEVPHGLQRRVALRSLLVEVDSLLLDEPREALAVDRRVFEFDRLRVEFVDELTVLVAQVVDLALSLDESTRQVGDRESSLLELERRCPVVVARRRLSTSGQEFVSERGERLVAEDEFLLDHVELSRPIIVVDPVSIAFLLLLPRPPLPEVRQFLSQASRRSISIVDLGSPSRPQRLDFAPALFELVRSRFLAPGRDRDLAFEIDPASLVLVEASVELVCEQPHRLFERGDPLELLLLLLRGVVVVRTTTPTFVAVSPSDRDPFDLANVLACRLELAVQVVDDRVPVLDLSFESRDERCQQRPLRLGQVDLIELGRDQLFDRDVLPFETASHVQWYDCISSSELKRREESRRPWVSRSRDL